MWNSWNSLCDVSESTSLNFLLCLAVECSVDGWKSSCVASDVSLNFPLKSLRFSRPLRCERFILCTHRYRSYYMYVSRYHRHQMKVVRRIEKFVVREIYDLSSSFCTLQFSHANKLSSPKNFSLSVDSARMGHAAQTQKILVFFILTHCFFSSTMIFISLFGLERYFWLLFY